MTRLRVLVVEDSLTVRRHLCDVLNAHPDIEVVGEAGDGKEAIHLCEQLRPDVVSMDMMLPVMSGMAATEYIMAHCPTPILVVSASTNRGEMFKTYEALAAGAIDVLEKPSLAADPGEWEARLIAALKMVARVRPIHHPRAKLEALRRAPFDAGVPAVEIPQGARAWDVVAIGASTGGPGAVLQVLKGLVQPFPVPVLVVVHISEPFGSALAEWLDAQTGMAVEYAVDGQAVASTAGRVTMAPPGWHLVVRHRRMRLTKDPERHSCRPSVDVLFESVAAEYGPAAAACLLTGMGRDGAAGLLAVRRSGGFTIAQDEATSVVYGMPREAALIGAAERVLTLPAIGGALSAPFRRTREGGR